MTPTVLVAGSTGMLGNRIANHLLDQPDVAVRLLLRPSALSEDAKPQTAAALVSRGAIAVIGDVTDPASLDPATAGVDVVVSALQGGRQVILDGQVALAESAVRNGLRRFIPSDFAIDLFKAPAGAPQFDLRREADDIIDALPLEVVHVLNGAFMDMMLDPNTAGLIDLNVGTATLWGTGNEPSTSPPSTTPRFTSRIATDSADLAGIRYFSGAETTFNAIIAESERLSGKTLTRNVMGSADDLRRITADANDPWSVVQEWYFLSMLTVPPFPTNENDRYADAQPTGLHEYLADAHHALRQS